MRWEETTVNHLEVTISASNSQSIYESRNICVSIYESIFDVQERVQTNMQQSSFLRST